MRARRGIAGVVGALWGLFAGVDAEAQDLAAGLQWSYAWRQVPSAGGFTQAGSARYTFAGLRARPLAPFRAIPGTIAGPFLEVNVATIRMTGANRVTVDSGFGYTFALTPSVGIGPVIGYHRGLDARQVFSTDPYDFVSVGFNLVVDR